MSTWVNFVDLHLRPAVSYLEGLRQAIVTGDVELIFQGNSNQQHRVSLGKKIFITHGRNELVRRRLVDFLKDRLHLQTVVLQEVPDLGKTLIEKLEHYIKDCGYAIVLLTGDDLPREETAFPQARQNVIYELGYFHGRFGRARVIILYQKGVSIPSMLLGLGYKEFDKDHIEATFEKLRQEFESLGIIEA